jgi:hypothetical protein
MKRVLPVLLAIVIIVGVAVSHVSAGRGSTFIFYVDSETLQPIRGQTLFPIGAVETFALKRLDGTIFTVTGDLRIGYWRNNTGIFVTGGIGIDGYIVGYPVPDGYRVVDVYCVNSWRNLDRDCHSNCTDYSHWLHFDSDHFIVIEKIVPILGDVNGDGFINAADITLLRRYIAADDKEEFLVNNPHFNLANADVNGDGVIDELDVDLLRIHLASTDPSTIRLGRN